MFVFVKHETQKETCFENDYSEKDTGIISNLRSAVRMSKMKIL